MIIETQDSTQSFHRLVAAGAVGRDASKWLISASLPALKRNRTSVRHSGDNAMGSSSSTTGEVTAAQAVTDSLTNCGTAGLPADTVSTS